MLSPVTRETTVPTLNATKTQEGWSEEAEKGLRERDIWAAQEICVIFNVYFFCYLTEIFKCRDYAMSYLQAREIAMNKCEFLLMFGECGCPQTPVKYCRVVVSPQENTATPEGLVVG